jgi:DNA-binding MarR family transcriptional regulator
MQPVGVKNGAETAEDAVVGLMLAIGRRFRARTDSDIVDPPQAALLFTLKTQGAMRLGDLAECQRLDASTVSRHVQQLGDRGLIDREPDPEDGRARIIAISDAGCVALKHTFDQRRAFLNVAMADWDDDERARLRDDLVRLTEHLPDV